MIKQILGATLAHCRKLRCDLVMVMLHANCFVLDSTQPRLIMIWNIIVSCSSFQAYGCDILYINNLILYLKDDEKKLKKGISECF
jgi:hypothetical protein